MNIVPITSDWLRRWDRFVAGHPDGGIYHSSVWKDVIEEAFPHIVGRFIALTDGRSGEIVGGIPLYEVNSWLLGRRLVSVPFATWCNPIADCGAHLKLLLDGASRLCDETSAKRVEIRCRRGPDLSAFEGWGVEGEWKHHVTATGEEPEEIWRKLSRTAVRRMVTKAEGNGVEVVRDDSRNGLVTFYDALVETRRRLSLPVIPIQFFASAFDKISPQQRVLLAARQGGEVIGGVVGVHSGDAFNLEYAAGSPRARDSGAMQLLYWRALESACEMGCREFSFGRTAPENEGLRKYKLHWASREEDLVSYVWRRSEGRRRQKGSGSLAKPIVRWSLGRLPGPACKLFGDAFYRHWG